MVILINKNNEPLKLISKAKADKLISSKQVSIINKNPLILKFNFLTFCKEYKLRKQ